MTNPPQSETEAMKAFLALPGGDLTERAKAWLEALKEIQGNLAGGSKDEQTKNTKVES